MRDICPLPLLFLAVIEARRYKWEKSVQARRDVGDCAICEWFKRNWKTWYNTHWVEHLRGQRFFDGLTESEFNIASTIEDDQVLVNTILESLKQHGNMSENLGLISWARDLGKDLDKVIKILRKIDINSKRYIWDEDTVNVICKALIEAEKHKWIESQKARRDLGDNAIRDWFFRYWNAWLDEYSSRVNQ